MDNNEQDLLEAIIESEEGIIEKEINIDEKLTLKHEKEFESKHWYFKYRIDVLKRLIKGNIIGNDLSILEVGVGTGTIAKELEQYGECIHIDCSDDVIEFNNDIKILKGLLPWEMPIKDKLFDYIILFNIIEYQENDDWMFDVLKNYLKPDGKILVSTLIGTSNYDKADKLYDIKRRYELEELKLKFFRLGFDIKDYTFFEKHQTNKQLTDSFNKFVDEDIVYYNLISKDNDDIYNYFKEKEFPKIGINRISSGKQIFLKLEKMKSENRQSILNKMYEKENKEKLIDKIIDIFAKKE